MIYATNYDIGERKRHGGINEDSVAINVIEQGHRDGFADDEAGHGGAVDWDDRPTDGAARPPNRGIAVFALADGAGGYEAGDVASYIATTVICEELGEVATRVARSNPDDFDVSLPDALAPEQPSPAEIQAALEDAITAAHREIINYASETGNRAYTTAMAGLSFDGTCYYAWVGDSRAYLVNEARETIELLTKDHGVVEELHDCGEVDDVEAHVHPRGNEITRALGGTGDQDPETATIAIDSNAVSVYAEDVLLVTSDGLIDAQTDAPDLYDEYQRSGKSDEMAETVYDAVVTDEEIRAFVLDADSLVQAGRELLAMANDRGGKDNLSVLFVRDPALPPTPRDRPLRRSLEPTPLENRATVLLPDTD